MRETRLPLGYARAPACRVRPGGSRAVAPLLVHSAADYWDKVFSANGEGHPDFPLSIQGKSPSAMIRLRSSTAPMVSCSSINGILSGPRLLPTRVEGSLLPPSTVGSGGARPTQLRCNANPGLGPPNRTPRCWHRPSATSSLPPSGARTRVGSARRTRTSWLTAIVQPSWPVRIGSLAMRSPWRGGASADVRPRGATRDFSGPIAAKPGSLRKRPKYRSGDEPGAS